MTVKKLLSPRETAEVLSVSLFTVRRLIWRGELPAVRVGRLLRIAVSDIEFFIDARKARSAFDAEAEANEVGGRNSQTMEVGNA